MDACEVLDVLGDDHAFLGGRDRHDLGVWSRIHTSVAHVHGIVAAIVEQLAGRMWEHLIEQESHGLRGHEVVACLRDLRRPLCRVVVGGDLCVDLVAMGGGVVDRGADVPWVQIELLGEHVHALFLRPGGVAQGGDDLPDVGSDRERGAATGGPVAEHDPGMIQDVEALGDEPFEQGTLGGVLGGRLRFQPCFDRGVNPVRGGS